MKEPSNRGEMGCMGPKEKVKMQGEEKNLKKARNYNYYPWYRKGP